MKANRSEEHGGGDPSLAHSVAVSQGQWRAFRTRGPHTAMGQLDARMYVHCLITRRLVNVREHM